jgi:hypothetical protein
MAIKNKTLRRAWFVVALLMILSMIIFTVLPAFQ